MDVDEINLCFDEYRKNSYLTHNYHPYPAKFVPQIPAELIRALSRPGNWVLDPFCGSGTALVEAKLAGRNSVGVDVNPLSCLVSRVKTKVLSKAQELRVQDLVAAAEQVVRAKRSLDIPKFDGMDKWFCQQVQCELAALLSIIRDEKEPEIREFLEVAFSAIVVKVSNQESDTRYKAVSKSIQKYAVANLFADRVNDMLQRMGHFRSAASGCVTTVVNADSTQAMPDKIFDLAVTSPPYMNSYDYYLYHKHRMNWLGMNHRKAQAAEFGSRNKHNDQKLGLDAYEEPIRRNARLVYERLKDGGHYCVVVGDAILRGALIKMNEKFDELLGSVGFRKVREISFPQRKYTRTFTPGLRVDHKDSYVLAYVKE